MDRSFICIGVRNAKETNEFLKYRQENEKMPAEKPFVSRRSMKNP